ncbi:hypothetical protein RvY_09803 [Ramazzottius varieornatus]|uniref:Uncharacterized protein n=1 Tax=Ramazzottius varieornatus TaxID=947166 RepID=A0A1D1VAL9_RAMVA|nr:hypothetical protein RvY_09803 [Ramazzottius varieornatus]
MKAALRGYQDGSLRYLQPDWHQCTVYESPSNSLFEVIVRDVPAEITDKEWYDCIMHYGNIRALQRIPEQHSGLVDMFIAMEDQRSHNVIKALLITLGKYNATLSDIFYGTFVPPAAFSAGDSTGLKESPSSGKLSSLRALRDFRSAATGITPILSPSETATRLRTKEEPFQAVLKRHDGLPNIRTKTIEFPRVPVTLLTRTRANQAFLPYNLLHHPEEKKSPVRKETRKDPSDKWFSCGEECVSESPKPMPVQQPMFQYFRAHREPENECSFLTDAKVMPRCESTVLNASPGRGRSGSAVSRKDSCIMEESHSPHQPQSPNRWNLQPVHSSPIRRGSQRLRHRENRKDYKRRKRRESTLADSFSNGSSQSNSKSPQAMYSALGNRQLPRSHPEDHHGLHPEPYSKIKEHYRRYGSDPTSLKQFMQSRNMEPLRDPSLPQARKLANSLSSTVDASQPAEDQYMPSGNHEDANKLPQAPASLMGVPFPCDQAPLRDYYNTAKMEGRVVTLRFSESKTSGLPAVPLKDNELTPEERIEEKLLIAKWQRAHRIFQLRKSKLVREKSPCRRSVSPLYRSKPLSSSTLVTRRAYVEISDKLSNASLRSNGGPRRLHVESHKPFSRLSSLFSQSSDHCTSSSVNDDRQSACRVSVMQNT